MKESKPLKVLYAVPYAHRPGHYPRVAISESNALAQAGIEVALLTFDGILDGYHSQRTPHFSALSFIPFSPLLRYIWKFLDKNIFTRFFLHFLETSITLGLAILLSKKGKFDLIHLRDGDPFIFLPHLLGLFTSRNWVVVLLEPRSKTGLLLPLKKSKLREFLRVLWNKFLNLRLWQPIYKMSFRKNRFFFLCHTEEVRRSLSDYMGGVLADKLFCVPLATMTINMSISQKEARIYLNLPRERPLFLLFGANHLGKNIEVVFQALRDLPQTILVYAGKVIPDIVRDPFKLTQKYCLKERTVIRDYYIPEEEKPYYFSAADAIILSYSKDFISSASLLNEASSFALPVIASDVGEVGKLVKNHKLGLLFQPEDKDSLKEAVVNFLRMKKADIEKLRNNCRYFCSRYSLAEWAQRMREIYERFK